LRTRERGSRIDERKRDVNRRTHRALAPFRAEFVFFLPARITNERETAMFIGSNADPRA